MFGLRAVHHYASYVSSLGVVRDLTNDENPAELDYWLKWAGRNSFALHEIENEIFLPCTVSYAVNHKSFVNWWSRYAIYNELCVNQALGY